MIAEGREIVRRDRRYGMNGRDGRSGRQERSWEKGWGRLERGVEVDKKPKDWDMKGGNTSLKESRQKKRVKVKLKMKGMGWLGIF